MRLVRLYLFFAAASFAAASVWQVSMPLMAKPAGFGIHFYRHVLGELDGRSCGSYPVCSSYAAEAVAKHGWLTGSWLMIDRLIHEGDDMKRGYRITVDGEQRNLDPLSRNDFWLKQ